MKGPGVTADEPARLAALMDLGLLDTPSEERFDRITRTAARLLDADPSTPSMDEMLQGLWERLAAQERDNARLLSARLDEVVRHQDRAAWDDARALAHRLAGTLGSLGQADAGREALAIEALAAGVDHPDDALLQRVVAHAIELRRRLDEPSGPAA